MNVSTPTAIRWTIRFLSTALFFLLIWMLGFVLGDIDDIDGPDRRAFDEAAIDKELSAERRAYQAQLESITIDRTRQEEIKQNRSEAMGVAKETWAQVESVHRLELDAGRQPGGDLRDDLAQAHERYIQAQATYEEANTTLADLGAREYSINKALAELNKQIQPQEQAAYSSYRRELDGHEFKLGAYKMAFIVPLLLVAARVLAKKRESLYRPIYKAVLLASFCQVTWIMHQHLPAVYFKYIAIIAAVAIVAAFLIHVLKSAYKPRPDLLLKLQRDAYNNHNCPSCAYPFPAYHPGSYTCPSCGTGLFDSCNACGASRHSLLPYCVACGNEGAAMNSGAQSA